MIKHEPAVRAHGALARAGKSFGLSAPVSFARSLVRRVGAHERACVASKMARHKIDSSNLVQKSGEEGVTFEQIGS
jgi:hypothetical protein